MKLVYANEAIIDLEHIREEITQHQAAEIANIATELADKIELLPDFPKLGVPVELALVPGSVRDIVFGEYRVRYSVHASVIIILRISPVRSLKLGSD